MTIFNIGKDSLKGAIEHYLELYPNAKDFVDSINISEVNNLTIILNNNNQYILTFGMWNADPYKFDTRTYNPADNEYVDKKFDAKGIDRNTFNSSVYGLSVMNGGQ